MKFLKPKLWFAVFFVLFVACNSDDDNNNSVELNIENLTGTYEITFLTQFFESTVTASNGDEVIIETENCAGDTFTDAQLVFNVDGTVVSSGNYRNVCETVINGQTETTENIETLEGMNSFSVNTTNNTIIIDGTSASVILFDGNNLQIMIVESDTFGEETENFSTEIRMIRRN